MRGLLAQEKKEGYHHQRGSNISSASDLLVAARDELHRLSLYCTGQGLTAPGSWAMGIQQRELPRDHLIPAPGHGAEAGTHNIL